ncbi:FUSC family protein [Litchfieldia alkalitelluris]|uniref:FUSC family protein n=1 Tax=Litchfieldia alkalitelluris TaxID=304268 RepID=UPI000998D359|nr:aromatic acid exporter family protein [Litchfieldia alkalitelluris]
MKYLTRIFGSRILKTGLAVFLTALLCKLLDLPAIFAVVTAIVTIEPTAADSIKKGIVRLPASAIGAAFSMTYAALLGDVPLAYTLATICTIFTCHKLKLEAGILVATLTAVTMIPFTPDHFLTAFFTRLGTTTIGLLVSTLVNLFILPPDYSKKITKNIRNAYHDCSRLLERQSRDIVKGTLNNGNVLPELLKIEHSLLETKKLCEYKYAEWKFHRHTEKQERLYHFECKHIEILQQVIYHFRNLSISHTSGNGWKDTEEIKVLSYLHSLSTILRTPYPVIPTSHQILTGELEKIFFKAKETSYQSYIIDKEKNLFSSSLKLLYEILSINELLIELTKISMIDKPSDTEEANQILKSVNNE